MRARSGIGHKVTSLVVQRDDFAGSAAIFVLHVDLLDPVRIAILVIGQCDAENSQILIGHYDFTNPGGIT